MSVKFTQSFKIQSVEKALNRQDDVSLKDIADSLGVGHSTLSKWVRQSRNQEFEPASPDEINRMTKEKRPQDWSTEERLNMVIVCDSLDDEAISERCRANGLYPHHIKQWKQDFVSGDAMSTEAKKPLETKVLKKKINELQKELSRKDRALAETAALLVLQKKVHTIWGSDEDSSQ